ncbi:hypothetical protein DS906_00630 [Ruegeria sp. A3M17]|nr:hypothetical protein DS906_00630 [Ruegeria sp. A3M17]
MSGTGQVALKMGLGFISSFLPHRNAVSSHERIGLRLIASGFAYLLLAPQAFWFYGVKNLSCLDMHRLRNNLGETQTLLTVFYLTIFCDRILIHLG